jgi:hypothetical protein
VLVTNAPGAALTNVEGSVQVDHGNGFKPVTEPVLLVPGDRVFGNTGAASFLYEDNCFEKMKPNQMVIVLAEPPACSLKDGGIANAPSDSPDLPADAFTAASLLAFGGGVAAALANSGTGSSVSP